MTKELLDIAQILTTIITVIGVFASIWLSIKALREVQRDRKLNHKPYLIFERGAHRIPIEFKKRGKSIPGINPNYVKHTFSHLPDDIESVRVKKGKKGKIIKYGHLKNYGNGPAVNVKVLFKPQKIWVGKEMFKLKNQKLKEPQYKESLNTLPISPSHVSKDNEGQLVRIPTFIEKDFEKKITRIDGILKINYFDIFNQKHTTKQVFRIFTGYEEEEKYLQFVFGDLKNKKE
jgi:hypothetical protein